MIKFLARKAGGGGLIGLGLVPKNLELLQQGKPVLVKLKDLAKPGETLELVTMETEFFIFFGETEEKLQENLQEFMDANTLVVPKPPRGAS